MRNRNSSSSGPHLASNNLSFQYKYVKVSLIYRIQKWYLLSITMIVVSVTEGTVAATWGLGGRPTVDYYDSQCTQRALCATLVQLLCNLRTRLHSHFASVYTLQDNPKHDTSKEKLHMTFPIDCSWPNGRADTEYFYSLLYLFSELANYL